MVKKILLALVVLGLVAGIGLFFWARAVLGGDGVRRAVEAQLTKAIGAPVSVASIGVTIVPRVTMALEDVKVGEPARVTVTSFHVGTDLRALLSRRIEHASVRLNGARLQLPLPLAELTGGSTPPTSKASRPAVELVSVDEILLTNVDVVSGGRTLHGDIEIVAAGSGFAIRRIALAAGETSINVTGTISDFAGPVGELDVKARGLDVLELVTFLSDFSKGTGLSAGSGTAKPSRPAQSQPAGAAGMNLAVTLEADRAVFGTLVAERVSGKGRITPAGVTVDPARFSVFGGQYDGTLGLTLSQTPAFTLAAAITGIDMGAISSFGGKPDAMTGTMSGRIDIAGRGATAAEVLSSARGTARVDVVNGLIKGLGLVRGIILATSTRADSLSELGGTTLGEPFSALAATASIAGGSASTDTLRFESKDLLLEGTGGFKLDGSGINLAARVQLSEALSKQAGRDLLRYTQSDGRVTLPVTVSGALGGVRVRVDAAAVAKRAIVNRAGDEAGKAIKKGLGDLLGR